MNKWIWAVVVVVIAGGAYLWWSQSQAPAVDQGASSSATQDMNATGMNSTANIAPSPTGVSGATVSGTVAASTGGAPMSATVSYDGNSFSPSSLTIAKGGTVKFVDTAGSMWVASNPHPTHTGYDGTSRDQHCASGYSGAAPFDQCASGSSFSFTFSKAGSWGYHDHMNTGAHGTVVVQ